MTAAAAGKPHGHHERRTNRRRRPEPRSPLDEGTEQPTQENDLDPPVVTDGVKGPSDRGDTSGVFQRLQKEKGTEDDKEEIEGQEKPLNGGRPDPNPFHLPGAHGHGHGRNINRGHGPFGGNPEPHQEHTGQKDRKYGEKGLGAEVM